MSSGKGSPEGHSLPPAPRRQGWGRLLLGRAAHHARTPTFGKGEAPERRTCCFPNVTSPTFLWGNGLGLCWAYPIPVLCAAEPGAGYSSLFRLSSLKTHFPWCSINKTHILKCGYVAEENESLGTSRRLRRKYFKEIK